jgi:hypothetical protein
MIHLAQPNSYPTTIPGNDGAAALDDIEELRGILGGLAPVGFTPAHRLSALSAQDLADLEGTKGQRAADAALFFVGATDLEDHLKMESLKAAFEAAKTALGGHAPLVVLGRADAVDGKLLTEPLNWSNKKVRTETRQCVKDSQGQRSTHQQLT